MSVAEPSHNRWMETPLLPLPHETMRSFVTRRYVLSGDCDPRVTLLELFGPAVKTINSTSFAAQLATLATNLKRIDPQIDSDTIAHRHTPFDYYMAVASAATRERVRTSMFYGEPSSAFLHHNVLSSRVGSWDRVHRFCVRCASDDLRDYGVVYLRTFHQLPAVTICVIHHEALRGICRTCHERSRALNGAVLPCARCLNEATAISTMLDATSSLWLARESKRMLDRKFVLTPDQSSKLYGARLRAMGYQQIERTESDRFWTAIETFWNEHGGLGSFFEGRDQFSGEGRLEFFRRLINSTGAYMRPLVHLALMRFMFGDLTNIDAAAT